MAGRSDSLRSLIQFEPRNGQLAHREPGQQAPTDAPLEVNGCGALEVSVSLLTGTPLDTTCNILGDCYGFSAGKYTNGSACAAGTQVIGEAWQMLREGYADLALAGATDSMLNPLGLPR